MTGEMIRTVLRLALTKLIELPPATLASYEPWLRRKHIRWCLDNVGDFHPWDAEGLSTKELLTRTDALIAELVRKPVCWRCHEALESACEERATGGMMHEFKVTPNDNVTIAPGPEPHRFTPPAKPVVGCLCGSTKFKEMFVTANFVETLAGKIVLSIGCDRYSDQELFGHLNPVELRVIKFRLDELHKRKIDLADEILVLDVGGYIGDSTRSEIEYAQLHNKRIRYLSGEPNYGAAVRTAEDHSV